LQQYLAIIMVKSVLYHPKEGFFAPQLLSTKHFLIIKILLNFNLSIKEIAE